MMYTRKFWGRAGERALKSAAQGAVTVLGLEAFDVVTAPWYAAASAGLSMAVISLLMSVASAKVMHDDDPSLVE